MQLTFNTPDDEHILHTHVTVSFLYKKRKTLVNILLAVSAVTESLMSFNHLNKTHGIQSTYRFYTCVDNMQYMINLISNVSNCDREVKFKNTCVSNSIYTFHFP